MTPVQKPLCHRPIGLLTDFGMTDPYVGQMKAVLAQHAPESSVIDITHDVVPYDIAQAGFFLAASLMHFPSNAVILSVVDPGVGTSRRLIGLQLDTRLLVAPDNGLVSLALKISQAQKIQAFDFSATVGQRTEVSSTFHGRDIFAPLTAQLALGVPPATLGCKLDPSNLTLQPWANPYIEKEKATCHILHIDRFGNCILNLQAHMLRTPGELVLTSPQRSKLTPVKTYANIPQGAIGILEGSQGFLELAANSDSAATLLRLSRGTSINLQWEP